MVSLLCSKRAAHWSSSCWMVVLGRTPRVLALAPISGQHTVKKSCKKQKEAGLTSWLSGFVPLLLLSRIKGRVTVFLVRARTRTEDWAMRSWLSVRRLSQRWIESWTSLLSCLVADLCWSNDLMCSRAP